MTIVCLRNEVFMMFTVFLRVLTNCEPASHASHARVKLSFYGLEFSARVKRCLGLNTYLQRLAFS